MILCSASVGFRAALDPEHCLLPEGRQLPCFGTPDPERLLLEGHRRIPRSSRHPTPPRPGSWASTASHVNRAPPLSWRHRVLLPQRRHILRAKHQIPILPCSASCLDKGSQASPALPWLPDTTPSCLTYDPVAAPSSDRRHVPPRLGSTADRRPDT